MLQLFHVWSEGMGVPQIDRPEKQMGFHISIAQCTHTGLCIKDSCAGLDLSSKVRADSLVEGISGI